MEDGAGKVLWGYSSTVVVAVLPQMSDPVAISYPHNTMILLWAQSELKEAQDTAYTEPLGWCSE